LLRIGGLRTNGQGLALSGETGSRFGCCDPQCLSWVSEVVGFVAREGAQNDGCRGWCIALVRFVVVGGCGSSAWGMTGR
jgi:hypothetical protein